MSDDLMHIENAFLIMGIRVNRTEWLLQAEKLSRVNGGRLYLGWTLRRGGIWVVETGENRPFKHMGTT